jgi:hypothetical protein
MTRASSTIAATAIATSDAVAAPVRKPSAQCFTLRSISGQLIIVIFNFDRFHGNSPSVEAEGAERHSSHQVRIK